MEHQSRAILTTEDKIVAIILFMRELKLNFLLAANLQQQNGKHTQMFSSFICFSHFLFFFLSSGVLDCAHRYHH
jgi:hypothetical protein